MNMFATLYKSVGKQMLFLAIFVCLRSIQLDLAFRIRQATPLSRVFIVLTKFSFPIVSWHVHPQLETPRLEVLEGFLLRRFKSSTPILLLLFSAEVFKVRYVKGILDVRHPRCWQFTIVELLKVKTLEPRMFTNVVMCATQASKAGCLSASQELLEQVLGLRIDLWGTRIIDHDDALEQANLIRSREVKRRASDKHFKNEDTKRPVVDALVVTLGHDDLRGQILWSTAQSVGFVDHHLCETQIDHNTVALIINKCIFWFHITVHNVTVVQMGECLQNTASVKDGGCVGDTILFLSVYNVEEFPPLDQWKQQVQIFVVLECSNQTKDEGVIDRFHDLLLS